MAVANLARYFIVRSRVRLVCSLGWAGMFWYVLVNSVLLTSVLCAVCCAAVFSGACRFCFWFVSVDHVVRCLYVLVVHVPWLAGISRGRCQGSLILWRLTIARV